MGYTNFPRVGVPGLLPGILLFTRNSNNHVATPSPGSEGFSIVTK